MRENYLDVISASNILDVHRETVKRLIREVNLTASKFGNKWVIEGTRSKSPPILTTEPAEGSGDCFVPVQESRGEQWLSR